jgi:hypothetical protein
LLRLPTKNEISETNMFYRTLKEAVIARRERRIDLLTEMCDHPSVLSPERLAEIKEELKEATKALRICRRKPQRYWDSLWARSDLIEMYKLSGKQAARLRGPDEQQTTEAGGTRDWFSILRSDVRRVIGLTVVEMSEMHTITNYDE